MKKIISQLLALQTSELESSKATGPESAAARKKIPAEMLNRFDKFLGRGKKAVILVQNGVCRGCQIQVPVGVINVLMEGSEVCLCGNCGRFLYIMDEDAQIFRDRNNPEKQLVVPKLAAPTHRPKVIRPSKKTRRVTA